MRGELVLVLGDTGGVPEGGQHPGGIAKAKEKKAIYLERQASHTLEETEQENEKDQGFELGDFELV